MNTPNQKWWLPLALVAGGALCVGDCARSVITYGVSGAQNRYRNVLMGTKNDVHEGIRFPNSNEVIPVPGPPQGIGHDADVLSSELLQEQSVQSFGAEGSSETEMESDDASDTVK